MRLAPLAAAMLALAHPAAAAENAVATFTCDLSGAPGKMTLGIEYGRSFDVSQDARGNISGVFPVGVMVWTHGELKSAVTRYTFTGQNRYADFTEDRTYQRFRVQWEMDTRRNGLWMIVNPHGNPTRYFCAFDGLQP